MTGFDIIIGMSERIATDNLKESVFHKLSTSAYVYESPIKPRPGEKVRFWKDSPSHVGVFRNALDIITPDPRVKPLPVFAPQSGRIISLTQNFDEFGDGKEWMDKLNFVTVQVGMAEFYELCHIAKGSCLHRVGDEIRKGERIAQTGANGWMTDVRHLHFMVGRWTSGNNFQSLKIRFESLKG